MSSLTTDFILESLVACIHSSCFFICCCFFLNQMVLLVDLRRVYPASRPMVAGIATPTARDPDKDMLKRMNGWMVLFYRPRLLNNTFFSKSKSIIPKYWIQ